MLALPLNAFAGFVPIFMPIHTGSGGGCARCTGFEVLAIILVGTLFFYYFTLVMERACGSYNPMTTKQFRIYFFIPFSWWIVGFVNLFKDE